MLLALTLIMTSCGNDKETLMDVPVMSDYMQFDYNGLKSEAQIIAKIQVEDDLSADNTQITYDPYEETQKSIIGYLGLRKVKILEIYKGSSVQAGDIMQIIEPAGVTKTQLLHDENYTPMANDGVYLVFLSNETASGEYGIISANNGIVNLSNPGNTGYLEILVKSIIEYESDLSNESKAAILQSKITQAGENEEKLMGEEVSISIKDANGKEISCFILKYGFDQTNNTTYIMLNQ
jgi:hypothetical protein